MLALSDYVISENRAKLLAIQKKAAPKVLNFFAMSEARENQVLKKQYNNFLTLPPDNQATV